MKSWVELKVEDEGINKAGCLVVDEDGDIYIVDHVGGCVCVWSEAESYIGIRQKEPTGLRKFHGRIVLEQ